MTGGLAQLARATVSGASKAALTIQGCSLGPDGGTVIGLHADDGWPVFWCDLGSAVAVAAEENRTAVLTVRGPAEAAQMAVVLLEGRLEMIGSGRERGRQVGAVMLALERVLVETGAAYRSAVSRVVPVSDYADAGPRRLAVRAAQIAGHTNAAHSHELCCFAAARAGVPAGQVAAAWLTGLNERGALVGWVDPSGGHTMTVSFPRQARTATELAMLLREQLTAGHPGTTE